MTFSTGEVTTGLINGKIIFRTREMNRRDQPEEAIVCLFESNFTGKRLPLFALNKTAPLRISLLD
jgi:hypothetical protein